MNSQSLKDRAKHSETPNKKLFEKLKKSKPKDLDKVVGQIHSSVFEKINCLECANCCKTTSPIFYQRDIERLAKRFRMRPAEFIVKYLHEDADSDYVLNTAPCAFLGTDNYCSVYEDRPNACREYPHTDRKRFHQILDLTLKNISVCPAVFEIVEKLKEVYNPVKK